jgi:thiol-disulfide isomerase/thioredoxin
MKKYVFLLIISIFLVGQVLGTAKIEIYDQTKTASSINSSINKITKAVFSEECTATWCPNCPYGEQALYNIYQSGDYQFTYVALIHDMNPNAKERLDEYTMGIYKGYAFPTLYLIGGIENIVGRGNTIFQTESNYRELIEEIQDTNINHQIDLQTTVEWLGDSVLNVNVDIKNNENSIYFGKIRSYIVEIESRWNTFDGDPYHFGFLDFAINNPILLMPSEMKSISIEWDGKGDHNGITFEDLVKNNIVVISTVSHWRPYYRTGYESNTFKQKYFAYEIDQIDNAIPS